MSDVTFESWIEHLRLLFAPAGLLHVGAGGGATPVPYQDWPIEKVLLIDADERNQRALVQLASTHPGWQSVKAVIDKVSRETDFFDASSPGESGLIDPEHLRPIWPNLRITGSKKVVTTRIDELLPEFGNDFKDCNWLVIACLPPSQVIESLGVALDKIDVLVARVTLPAAHLDGLGADIASIDRVLAGKGFRCLHVAESRQPLIAHVVYTRDWQHEAGKLTVDRNQQSKIAAEWASQLEQLQRALDEQTKLAQQRGQEVDSLKQKQGQLEQEKAAVVAARDEQTKLAQQRGQEVDSLKQKQGQLEQEKAAVVAARDEQTKLAAGHLKQVTELQGQIQSRQSSEAELTTRQQLMHEEMVRAEAQLDLIKEMLLREPRL
jgi:hypothetical protein